MITNSPNHACRNFEFKYLTQNRYLFYYSHCQISFLSYISWEVGLVVFSNICICICLANKVFAFQIIAAFFFFFFLIFFVHSGIGLLPRPVFKRNCKKASSFVHETVYDPANPPMPIFFQTGERQIAYFLTKKF